MKVQSTAIAGLHVVHAERRTDTRGWFYRAFCEQELDAVFHGRRIVQANISQTAAVGAIRGLHYQKPPHAEMKLIRCLRGRVWDVAVDLRRGSPTFLKWHAETLSAEEANMTVIPEGCAHGFQVLEPDSELLYLHTAAYVPSAEGGLRYDDNTLAIAWPLKITELSPRDAGLPRLDKNFKGITP